MFGGWGGGLMVGSRVDGLCEVVLRCGAWIVCWAAAVVVVCVRCVCVLGCWRQLCGCAVAAGSGSSRCRWQGWHLGARKASVVSSVHCACGGTGDVATERLLACWVAACVGVVLALQSRAG
jgi:hypothetical protein